jgi:hypothetical protein
MRPKVRHHWPLNEVELARFTRVAKEYFGRWRCECFNYEEPRRTRSGEWIVGYVAMRTPRDNVRIHAFIRGEEGGRLRASIGNPFCYTPWPRVLNWLACEHWGVCQRRKVKAGRTPRWHLMSLVPEPLHPHEVKGPLQYGELAWR